MDGHPSSKTDVEKRIVEQVRRSVGRGVSLLLSALAFLNIAAGVSAGHATTSVRNDVPARTPSHSIRTSFFDNGILPLTVGSKTTKARSWGAVSAPTDGTGPFPLVILLHGAHAFCASGRARAWPCPNGGEVPNHDGLSWLAEALAAQGFVAVAIGNNEEYARPTSDVGAATASLIERDVLHPLAVPGARFASWLDPATVDQRRVVLVGHSRGGAVAAVLGRGDRARRLSVPVAASVLLAPTSDTVAPALLADVPTAVVIGSCDGDSGVDGGEYLTTTAARARRRPLALVLMTGANHNAVNDRLDPERVDPKNPDCAADARLNATEQRAQLSVLIPGVIRALTASTADPVAVGSVLDTTRPDDRVATGLRIVHFDAGTRRTSLLDPSGQWPAQAVTTSGFRSVACPAGRSSPYANPGTELCHRLEITELVGRPASIHLDWTKTGGTLRLSHRRLPAGGILVLRLFVDPLSVAPDSEMIAVVSGSDPGQARPGWSTEVRWPTARLSEPIAEAGLRRGVVLWSERRIVLPADSSSTSVTIRSPDRGAIDVVGIEFVSPG